MLRVFFAHLYVIVMAIIVITTSNILASRYGDDIVNGIQNLVRGADNEVSEVQESVKDWNKKMLD